MSPRVRASIDRKEHFCHPVNVNFDMNRTYRQVNTTQHVEYQRLLTTRYDTV